MMHIDENTTPEDFGKQSKHSPGPWISLNDHVDDRNGLTLFRKFQSVCNPLDFHLAATAPELLEQLQSLVLKAEEAGWHESETEEAREVIRKATGHE